MSQTKEEYELEIGKAIEHAAEALPTGYSIDLNIESGGWGIKLNRPSGSPLDCSEPSIKDSVEWLVNMACGEDYYNHAPCNELAN